MLEILVRIACSMLLRHKIVVWRARGLYVNNSIRMLIEGGLDILENQFKKTTGNGILLDTF